MRARIAIAALLVGCAEVTPVGSGPTDAGPTDAGADVTPYPIPPACVSEPHVDEKVAECPMDPVRCSGFYSEQCMTDTWIRRYDDRCCTVAGRYSVEGGAVLDKQTGVTWQQTIALQKDCTVAAKTCAGEWRVATTDEVLKATIGGSICNEAPACMPALDREAFVYPESTHHVATLDGWVNIMRGQAEARPAPSFACAVMCVKR